MLSKMFCQRLESLFYKKAVLKNFSIFTRKLLCQIAQACNFNKRETPAQVFSCECCEIFNKTYFEEHLRMTASVAFLPPPLMNPFFSPPN